MRAPYDLEVDTSDSTPRACAERIVARLAEPPKVFEEVRVNRAEA